METENRRAVPPKPQILAQLERICDAALKDATVLEGLLRFIVNEGLEAIDNPERQISEYYIARQVFRRPSGWVSKKRKGIEGSKNDAIVRVNMAKIRDKIEEYYKSAGSRDPVVIEIPALKRGGYAVHFTYNPAEEIYPGVSEEVRRLIVDAKAALLERSLLDDARATTLIDSAVQLDPSPSVVTIQTFVRVLCQLTGPRYLRNRMNDSAIVPVSVGYPIPKVDNSEPNRMHGWIHERYQSIKAKAEAAAEKRWEAIYMDAYLKAVVQHQWLEALKLFEEATMASHGEALYYWWYPALLAAFGYHEKAIRLLEEALKGFAAGSISMRCDLALLYLIAGRVEQAEIILDEAVERNGQINHLLSPYIGMYMEAVGRPDVGIDVHSQYLNRMDNRSPKEVDLQAALPVEDLLYPPAASLIVRDHKCYSMTNVWTIGIGIRLVAAASRLEKFLPEYRKALAEAARGLYDYQVDVRRQMHPASMPCFQLAIGAAGIGLFEEAVSWLNLSANHEGDLMFALMGCLPWFKPLHGYQPFLDLAADLKLPIQSKR